MYRLKVILALVACLVLSAACGGGGAPEDGGHPNGPVTVSEQAVLGGVTPVDDRIAQALDGLTLPRPELLPGLPGKGVTERRASAAETSNRNGADYYSTMKSDNATVDGTRLHLDAAGSGLSWAVFQFPIGAGSNLNKLTVHASNGNFTGSKPGYWIGLADYSAGVWRPIALMSSTDSPYVRTFDISSSAFLSAGNNLYVFILTHDGQAVDIDSLSLDYETVVWQHVEFGGGANNAGWTPALAFVKNAGALMILYADYNSRTARYGVWDMAGDFAQPASWAFMDVDGFNPLDTDIAGSMCKWLDLTQDPATGYPRVSMVYEGTSGGSTDSLIGLSVYITTPSKRFLNYRLGNGVYGGGYTSVDCDPVDGAYVVAHYVSNEGWTPPDDMNLRIFQINDPSNPKDDEDVHLIKNFSNEKFQIPCYFPHVRCLGDQHYAIATNGSIFNFIISGNNWNVLSYNDGEEHTEFGSVAVNSIESFWGYSNSRLSGGNSVLRFIEDLENPGAPVYDIDTASAGGWIGASQLAYKPDGKPGIAYTKRTGSGVDVKLAEYDGAAWSIATVSTVPCQPADMNDREAVLVDLDYDILGEPAVIWNQVNGTSSVAHVALRQN
jgi:hypothetical protein